MHVFRRVRMASIMNFVERNDPPASRPTGGDSWRAFLNRKGATGDTMFDLEQSYLRILNKPTFSDYLTSLGYTIGGVAHRLRVWLTDIVTTTASYIVQEDGTSGFTLEDNSGKIKLD